MLALVKLTRFFIVLLCLMAPAYLSAQASAELPAAKYITTVPFTILTGGIIILHATLDNSTDTLNFVLDTGSGGISIDSATCAYLKLKSEKSKVMIKGIAGIRPVEYTYNHTLKMNGIAVENLDFHINDYDILTSVYGLKIDGIIGYSFLHRYLVFINYEKNAIEILTNGKYKYPRGGYILHPSFNTLPIQPVSMKDKRSIASQVYFDTGAGLCFLLSDSFANDSAVLLEKKKLYPTLAQGLGGKADMRITTLKEVKIGPYKFRNVPTYVFNDPYNATGYPQVSGLIGNDILRRFHVVLNYAKREIYLKPNNFYRDSFDYSYTGLGIYLIDRKITVLDIMKDSPAEKAGLQIGDVIIGVNKDFTNNIQTYKALLQSAGESQNLLIQRENVGIFNVTLKVKSIY